MNDDLSPDLNTEERNRSLDQEILRSGEEIAGLQLRPISAGDMALLLDLGVNLLVGRTGSIFFDVGAIVFCQSRPKAEIRRLAARPQEFRGAVYDFLDTFEPTVFEEAQPRILEMIRRMNSARTSLKGETSGVSEGGESDPKDGGRAG